MTATEILEAWPGSRAPRLALVLDYDGTLVDIAPRPQDAAPDPALCSLLGRIEEAPGVRLVILSGRALPDLIAWLDLPQAVLVGSHGAEWRAPGGATAPLLCSAETRELALQAARELESTLETIPGALVERKGFGAAAHYRGVSPADQPRFEEAFAAVAGRHADRFEIHEGRKVLELRSPGVSKGAALVEVRCRLEFGDAPILAAGDDRTDEDTFAVLDGSDLSVKVGPAPTVAMRRLPDPAAVRGLLDELLRLRPGRRPG